MLSADIFGIETVKKLPAGVVSRDVAFNLTFQAVQQYGEVRGVHFKHEADKCRLKGLRVPVLSVKSEMNCCFSKEKLPPDIISVYILLSFP